MTLNEEVDTQIRLFFKLTACKFPGWKALQDNYKRERKNLGAGCARCRRNALKRKYASKIRKLVRLRNERNR